MQNLHRLRHLHHPDSCLEEMAAADESVEVLGQFLMNREVGSCASLIAGAGRIGLTRGVSWRLRCLPGMNWNNHIRQKRHIAVMARTLRTSTLLGRLRMPA